MIILPQEKLTITTFPSFKHGQDLLPGISQYLELMQPRGNFFNQRLVFPINQQQIGSLRHALELVLQSKKIPLITMSLPIPLHETLGHGLNFHGFFPTETMHVLSQIGIMTGENGKGLHVLRHDGPNCPVP